MMSDDDDESPSPLKIPLADVDPEEVRIALREFVNRLISTERDRVRILPGKGKQVNILRGIELFNLEMHLNVSLLKSIHCI